MMVLRARSSGVEKIGTLAKSTENNILKSSVELGRSRARDGVNLKNLGRPVDVLRTQETVDSRLL